MTIETAIKRRTWSQSFYTLVTDRYPAAKHHPPYLRALLDLLFPNSEGDFAQVREVYRERIFLWAHGRWPRNIAELDRFNSGEFLNELRSAGLPINSFTRGWFDPLSCSSAPTKIILDKMPSAIRRAALREVKKPVTSMEGRVYVTTGKPYTERRDRYLYTGERKAATQVEVPARSPLAQECLDTFNSTPRRLFLVTRENHQAVIDYITGTRDGDERVRRLAEAQRIVDSPEIFYRPVENSARMYCGKSSLASCPSDVRRTFVPDWTEVDLKHAHLSILARDWNLKEARALLESGGSLWDELTNEYLYKVSAEWDTPEVRDRLRQIWKAALPSIIYGQHTVDVARGLVYYAEYIAAAVFFQHPVVAELLAARDDWFGERGGITTQTKQELSEKISETELELLYPIVQMFRDMKRPDWHVVLYQYDGCSIHFARRKESWLPRIVNAVNENARRLGVPTSLEVVPLATDYSGPKPSFKKLRPGQSGKGIPADFRRPLHGFASYTTPCDRTPKIAVTKWRYDHEENKWCRGTRKIRLATIQRDLEELAKVNPDAVGKDE